MSGYWHKRRKTDNGEDHVDDWLMTYADMITLLLCFFAVFIAISVPEQGKFETAKQKVTEEFSGNSENMKGEFPLPPAPFDADPRADLPFTALPSIVDRHRDAPIPNKDVEVVKGDRITTIELNSAPFFPVGSSTLSSEGAQILDELQPTFLAPEYQDYTISVEGHTDDDPIKTPQFPSNWELSAARASAVVRYLVDIGIPPPRLRAVGYADSVPKAPNRDEAGNPLPDNQAQNRRVVIRLEKIVKAE